ncbi:RHS repeat-associated core domain-containing protein [Leptospira stimsonii]|uniref:Type IV secretion protein Rhs n=1 Tax=Leptospira stimsonii TaxID=2202203 RepID=A0ABY2MVR8_9LEPT|nr:RHS repeat-associated core domain-containing protein [Leptospira stimsonii]TGK15106.1 type IV secretion protein Rhs [Leptospira stimsonii]TGM09664.1 type IV secretion protein Rhs [Leptospira stimsonii]
MKNKKASSIILLILTSLFLIHWLSLNSITSFFYSLVSNEESSIPLPLPDISVDHTGKASFSIPVEVPPGAGDLVPSISLSYQSGNPDSGFLGKGWSLSGFPKVSKNPSFGIHNVASDQFVSDLTGELRSSGAGIFKSKTETFQKVTKNSNGWTVREKTGLESSFGSIPSSSSKIVDPSGNELAWAVDQVRDLNGNGYTISYFDSNSLPEFAPKEITYIHGNARIVFEYESRGSSFFKFFKFSKGGERRTQLSAIRVFAKDQSGTEKETATYDFSYDIIGGELLLKTIERENFEPLTFSYTNSAPSATSYSAASTNFQLTYRAFDSSKQRDCDFGALVCLCSSSAACMAASFGLAGEVCRSSVESLGDVCQNGIENSFTAAVDVSGDGVPEFVRVLGDRNGQYFSKLDMSLWEASTSNLSVNNDTLGDRLDLNANGKILPGDVNGDGKMDFVVLERNAQPVRIFFGPNFNSVSAPSAIVNIPNLASDTRNRHYVVDVNGDGKADFIQADDQLRLDVYLSNGSAFNFVQKLTISDFGSNFQQFVDLDQNGVPDFVRIDGTSSQRLLVTFFDSNGSTLNEIETNALSEGNFGKTGDQFFSDVNGDGLLDFSYFIAAGSDNGSLNVRLSDGRRFHSEAGGGSSIFLNETVANQDLQNMSLPSSSGYALYDINNDGSPDRVYYFGDYYQIEIYKPSTDSYLPPFNVNWSSDTVLDINFDGEDDKVRAGTFFWQQQMHVWFGPNDSFYSVDVNPAAMTPPPADMNALAGMSAIAYSNWLNRKEFADINGDGRADFIRFHNGVVRISFSQPSASGVPTFSANSDVEYSTQAFLQTADLNGDGRSELVGLQASALGMAVPIPSNIPLIGTVLYRNVPFHTFSKPNLIRFQPAVPNGLLSSVDGSFGRRMEITYDVAKQKVTPTSYNSSKPNVLPQTSSDFVVSKVLEKAGSQVDESTTYQYRYPKLFWNGLRNIGSLGYSEIVQTDLIRNVSTVSQYGDTALELAGIANYSATYKNGILLSETTNNVSRTVLGDGTIRVRQTGSSQVDYQNGSALTSSSISSTFDSFGNVLIKTTAAGSCVLEERTTYDNDATSWILGKPLRIESYKDGVLISQKEYVYSSDNRLAEERTYAGGSNWMVQKILQYDSYGNPIQVQDTRGNSVQVDIDPVVHKFPVKITNGLGHVTTKEYDFTKGLEISNIDANGQRSETHFDKFGRALETILPGMSGPLEKMEYANTGHPTNQTVKTTIQREDGEESWTIQYFNSRGQSVRKESSLVDAAVLVEESFYDGEGRLSKSIDPYIQGQAPFSWKDFEYDPEGRQKKVIGSDGKTSEILVSGFDSTVKSFQGATLVSTVTSLGNDKGELTEKVIEGKSTKYQYKTNGKIFRVTDPDNGTTHIDTDFLGRQTLVSNPNTGTVQYIYDALGDLVEQRYGNGSTVRFQYDSLGRVTSVIATASSGESETQIYEYDDANVPNAKGRLTKVTDSLGTTEFGYDARGNQTLLKKRIEEDDMTFLIEKTYNFQNQIASVTYPDGTIARNLYSKAGYLSGVTLTPGNGQGSDLPLVQYQGPFPDGSGVKIQRILGNGVNTDIRFDPAKKRPLAIITSKNSETYQSLAYEYDDRGNFTKIEDKVVPSRTQTFSYDSLNRMTQAIGKYGTEDYQYNDSGQLLQKGAQTYSYTNAQHKTAVTRVVNPNSNLIVDYAYDGSGNMIGRNGETMEYNPFQKLKRMSTQNGDTIQFDYDFSGTRIRKTRSSDGLRTISLGGLYEVVMSPGNPNQHTLYFRGLSGDLIAQWSRTDAVLRTAFDENTQEKNLISWLGTFLDNTNKNPEEFATSVSTAIQRKAKNTFHFARIEIANIIAKTYTLNGRIFIYSLFLILGLGFVYLTKEQKRFPILLRLTTPALILSLGISNCSVLMPKGSGDPPWLFPLALPATTPSVAQPYNPGGSGGGTSGVPVSGMIFFHPDHLGSITMITDGQGNRVAGGEMGGASLISYKPYGEINRNDSQGPDIFRYKYTGQEEDRETGLYYYNSRFYDPLIGRFTQADSVFDTSRPMAMDLYMYTEGNPVRWRDPSGHSIVSDALSKNGMGMLNFNIGSSKALSNAFFVSKQRWFDFGQGVRNVGAGVLGALTLLASPFLGVAYGLATNPKAFFHKPLQAIGSYAYFGVDYSVSLVMNPILGDPLPTVKNLKGATVIENSFSANHMSESSTAASTSGNIISMRTGSSEATLNHELGHVDQFYHAGSFRSEYLLTGGGRDVSSNEFDADFRAGTIGYPQSQIIFAIVNPQLYKLVYSLNLYNQTAATKTEAGFYIMNSILNSYLINRRIVQ